MGCHVPWRKPPLSSTQRAWRRRVQDCEKSVVLFVWKFCKEEWVNFTSSEWYDLLWKNKQIQGIIRQKWEWDVRRRFSPPSAHTSPHSGDSGCRWSVCLVSDGVVFVVEWWAHGEFCAISWKVDCAFERDTYEDVQTLGTRKTRRVDAPQRVYQITVELLLLLLFVVWWYEWLL